MHRARLRQHRLALAAGDCKHLQLAGLHVRRDDRRRAAAESGFDAPGEAWFGLVAPTGTPASAVQRLNREVSQVMASAQMQQVMAGFGFRTLHSTPEEFRDLIRQEHAKWGPLIRDAGLKIE